MRSWRCWPLSTRCRSDGGRTEVPLLQDWVLLTGAFTGAVAVASFFRSTLASIRERRRRHDLVEWLKRVLRIERRLSALAADLDDISVQGVTWAGWEAWPVEARGHAHYLAGFIDETERAEAAVRALDASGPLERLRADVEQLYVILRVAADHYYEGARRHYRDSNGEPSGAGAAGHEPVAMLADHSVDRVRELRANFVTLARSCLYRLGHEGHAEALQVRWPIVRSDVTAAHELNVWATEPRPISHNGLE